ncbi:MAG: ester cyclase [Polyangiaceae bacterium]|nr:ester cyclase [Polyangiaceae bacterium]
MDPFVQRLINAYNDPNLDGFDSLLSDDVVLVRDEEKARGRDAFKAVLTRLRRAFPDIQYHISDVVSSGDRLVLRWEARGTHRGEYLGVPGTGRLVSYGGITLYELRDGRVARAWVAADLLSLHRRLREGRDAAPEARA